MTTNPFDTSKYGAEMQAFLDQSMRQAQQAFDNFAAAAGTAGGRMGGQAEAARTGARDATRKVLAFAEENMMRSFTYMQSLTRAKDPSEVMKMHADYVQAQIKMLSDQAQEFGEDAAKAAKSGMQAAADIHSKAGGKF